MGGERGEERGCVCGGGRDGVGGVGVGGGGWRKREEEGRGGEESGGGALDF